MKKDIEFSNEISGEIEGLLDKYLHLKEAFDSLLDDKEVSDRETQFLNRIIDSVPNPFFFQSLSCECLLCNRALEELLSIQRKDVIGKNLVDLFPKKLYEQCVRIGEQVLSSEQTCYDELRIPLSDGTIRDILFQCGYFISEDGKKKGILFSLTDLTIQKQVERALNESKNQLKAQFNSIPIPMYIWNKVREDYRLVEYNNAAIEITKGLISDYVGQTARKMYSENPEVFATMEKCFREQTVIEEEMKYHFRSTGAVHDLIVRYAYVPSDTVLVLTEDVTEKNKNVRALEESEREYRELVEVISDGLIITDKAGVINFANEALARIMAHEDAELLIGKPFLDLIIDKNRRKFLHKILTHIKGRNFPEVIVEKIKRKDGNVRVVELRVSPFYEDDEYAGARGVISDITERVISDEEKKKYREELEKKVKKNTFELIVANVKLKREIKERRKTEELLEKRLKYEHVLSAFRQLLFLGEQNTEASITAALEQLRGVTDVNRIYICENQTDPLRGLCFRQAYEISSERRQPGRYFLPEGLQPYEGKLERWAAALKQKKVISEVMNSLPNAENGERGAFIPVLVLVIPIIVEGAWYGFIVFERERLDDWWSEEDLWLMRAITDLIGLNKEKQRAGEELIRRQKFESLGVLASGLAHNFNNILSGILLSLSISKKHVGEDSKIFELLNEAEKASRRAGNLSRQLVTFTKGGKPAAKTVLIEDLLKEVVDFALMGTNVESNWDIAKNLWPVHIDENQVSQVINNVIINAKQAMADKGKISIEADNYIQKKAGIISLLPGNYVQISIKDEGSGISEKDILNVFDPYFTTKRDGSGLGLTSSYSIIKKHGGHISVESEPGEGAEFHIFLPALPGADVEIKDKSRGEIHGTEKLLIVDDELAIRTLAAKGLKELGYEIETAANSDEALELFEKSFLDRKPFDLVILDLILPGGDCGEKVAEKIRKLDKDAKILAASGYSKNPIMANYSDYGFCGVLMKPFSTGELSEAIDKVINGPQE